MWVRKRIEIKPSDLVRGLSYCASGSSRQDVCDQIRNEWEAEDALICLSVRSGFDLLLHSCDWDEGSEVIMSGLTIPDMPRIVEENGLKAVGVDIDIRTMQPDIQQIRDSINSRTRAIVVAHLLGGICDISPVIQLAKEHNLLVIEDCAQAYVGSDYQGDERADISMFSFGPIKTNTALAGGVLRVRDDRLLKKMQRLHDLWKTQSRLTFAKRICKYGFVKVISTRPLCGAFYRIMKTFGSNHDGVASTMARGFAGPGFFTRIRQQPSLPLLKLLCRKLVGYDKAVTDKRSRLGFEFANAVGKDVHVLGSEMTRQTWWVLPLLVDQPEKLVTKLWDAGFDASNSCSLHAIIEDEDSMAAAILRHIVFLPLHPGMPESELTRMAQVILAAKPGMPLFLGKVQDSCEPTDSNRRQESGADGRVGISDPHYANSSAISSDIKSSEIETFQR